MIQQSHLTAWQVHAPWPKRSQIEQDLRLSRGVAAIFGDAVLSDCLAMRGGTVLHKAHLAPAARYSEDIDLVLVKALDTRELDRRLRSVLTPVLGKPVDSPFRSAGLALRNAWKPSKILRTEFRFVPLDLAREETIKVEVNLEESTPLLPLARVEIDSLDEDGELVRAAAVSYDINEMLGTKTRALLQREQGRDLFDLVHAWRLSEAGATPFRVDGAKAMEALAWYLAKENQSMGKREANAKLDQHLRNPAFRRDMDTLLRQELGRFDVDDAAALVRTAYFEHLEP